MLKLFSRLERTRSLIIIVFALLMGVSLVVFYAPGRNSADASAATAREVLARVDGDEIRVAELTQLRESYRQMFGGQINLAQLGGDKRLLDGLIRDRIVAQQATRLGLAPSDAEVADAIRKRYTDASGQFIGFERYKQAILSQFESVEQFEDQIRMELAGTKLRAFVTSGVSVSPAEVEENYKRKNTTFDLVYVPVVADRLAKNINLSDEELRRFYDEHKTDFRILEPQKKVRYLYIETAKVGEKLQVSEEDLRADFDKMSPQNKIAGARVQQIVLKVARPDLDAQVRAKADELVTQARAKAQNGQVPEDVFAELARGNSEDPATASKGGWLPDVVRRNPNNPGDPLQAAVGLEPGQVSESVKGNNVYYVFRRGETIEKTYDETTKKELRVGLQTRRAYLAASQLATRAVERLKATKDVQKVAEELAAEANMTPTDMVRETPFVKPGDDVPNIGSSQQFEQAIEPLNNQGDVGEQVGVKGGFAIPLLIERRDPRIPEFDEVKDKVAERARQDRAKSQLEQAARDLAANANSPGDLRAAAERLGLEVKTEAAYKLGVPLGDIGTSAAADDTIYNLKPGEITKTPVKVGESWAVVGVNSRKEADMAEFGKQREELTRAAVTERESAVYEDYVNRIRQQMERDGQIEIYNDVLAKVADDEPAVAPPGRPNPAPGT